MTALARVEAELAARQRREHLFPSALFADPAWDLLLALYRAELSGETLDMDEVCARTAAPRGAAARWIDVLEGRGLVSRPRDASEEATGTVNLTAEGGRALATYFGGT